MNYGIRKLIHSILFFGTLACGAIALGLSNKKDSNAEIFAAIFIIGLIATYILSFFIHDPNDGSDY